MRTNKETASYPNLMSSSFCALLLTTSMILIPQWSARAVIMRPKVEPAAVCNKNSPLGGLLESNNPYAVIGFTWCKRHSLCGTKFEHTSKSNDHSHLLSWSFRLWVGVHWCIACRHPQLVLSTAAHCKEYNSKCYCTIVHDASLPRTEMQRHLPSCLALPTA